MEEKKKKVSPKKEEKMVGEKPTKSTRGRASKVGTGTKDRGKDERTEVHDGNLKRNRLHEFYLSKVRPALMAERGLNIMEVPTISKIVVNVGVGEAKDNPKALESAIKTLTVITGRKPVVTRAKKSISNFKLRAGQPNGVYVTLRGQIMWNFLDKLINITLPRLRDFQGVSVKGFDGLGNYNLGFRDQLVFPEIVFDEIEHIKGLQVVIVTTTDNTPLAAELLYRLGMPFKDFKVAVEVA